MRKHPPGPAAEESEETADPESSLASVISINRREDIAGICGRIDTAPTFAVVLNAPDGNRQLSTELGMRRLQRHVEESGKVVAIATSSVALASRARQVGIPVARKPEHVRWDAGGRRVFRVFGHSLTAPALGRYVQVTMILALALIFAALALTMAPAASVTAYPPSEALSALITITASPDRNDVDFAGLEVPARKVTSKQRVTLVVKTTGKASVGTVPAKVIVSITNPTQVERLLPERAILLAGGDQTFELDLATAVPAGKTVTQQATATRPGITGNVPAGTVLRWQDEQYRQFTVTNPAPAAGGANEDRPGVDAQDLATIKQLAQDLQKSETVKRTLLTARPHDAVFLRTAETTVEFADPPLAAGTPADVLMMDVDVRVSAYAVLEDTLDAVARSVLQKGQGVGEFLPGSVSAVETGARQIDADTGTIRTEIQVQGQFARNVTAEALREAVKGKSIDDAKSTLNSRYGIQDADVSVSPGWAPWLPRFSFRIDVAMRSKAAQDAATAKGAASNGTPPAAPSPATPAAARP